MAGERQTYRKSVARNASLQNASRQRSRSTAGTGTSSGQRKAPVSRQSWGDKFDSVLESLLKGKKNNAPSKQTRVQNRTSRSSAQTGAIDSFLTRFLSSKVAIGITVIIALLLIVGLWDTLANYGKAYGNVSINGISVAGMNAEQIRARFEDEFSDKLAGEVRIYANDKAQGHESSDLSHQQDVAQAEQISVEDAKANVKSWVTSASGLRATVPYDVAIEQALAAGRNGGPLQRLSLFFKPVDVALQIQYDDNSVEKLAQAIDNTIGDERIDATVQIEEGMASAVKGHDGMMVDREWLKGKITEALMSEEGDKSFVAEAVQAPSRTTYEQAQQLSSDINRALNSGLTFRYHSQSWTADAVNIGEWTKVSVAKVEDGYELQVDIDSEIATSDLAKHLDATVTGGNVVVDFEKADDVITVRTSGSGVIPEVAPAVGQAKEALYGTGGIAWADGAVAPATIEVNESDAPEQLTLEQAVDLGVVTVIGEYTTEFSNAEGTENRNHNIKLAADLLNNTIAESSGGKWSFNDLSGDTNQDPPFASAGSIIDGEYVDSIGGGICQVATTVFNAVFEAGLDVDERRNHSLYIASYPTGRDAAVSYPEMNFVWSNPLASDVLLTLEYTDTTLTAKLFSTPTGYKVTTETGQWEEGEKYKTDFEVDDTLAEGDYYLKTTGSDGSQIEVTRTVSDLNGTVVKQDSFSSVYAPKNEVYLIGPGTDTSAIIESGAESGNTREEDNEADWESDEYDEDAESYDESSDQQEYLDDETAYDGGADDGYDEG